MLLFEHLAPQITGGLRLPSKGEIPLNALRDDIYNTLESTPGTYSIESLAHRYRTNEHVIRVQLDRLQQEGKKLKVTDDEVSVFLDHNRPLWLYAGWVGIGFIMYVLFSGVIHG